MSPVESAFAREHAPNAIAPAQHAMKRRISPIATRSCAYPLERSERGQQPPSLAPAEEGNRRRSIEPGPVPVPAQKKKTLPGSPWQGFESTLVGCRLVVVGGRHIPENQRDSRHGYGYSTRCCSGAATTGATGARGRTTRRHCTAGEHRKANDRNQLFHVTPRKNLGEFEGASTLAYPLKPLQPAPARRCAFRQAPIEISPDSHCTGCLKTPRSRNAPVE